MAALIGLEERERIDALDAKGVRLELLSHLAEAIWGKEGTVVAQREWEAALRNAPGLEGGTPDGARHGKRELELIGQILRELKRSNEAAPPKKRADVKVS